MTEMELRVAHEDAKWEWLAYLHRLAVWRRKCLGVTCYYCGERQSKNCCANAFATPGAIRKRLRRLAGISNGHAQQKSEWDGWGHGKDGPRGCGPSAWDNAIRALEEDR